MQGIVIYKLYGYKHINRNVYIVREILFSMEINFNKIQKGLLSKAKETGYLTNDDFVRAYACSLTIKANIKRFIALGILEWDEGECYYKYIGEIK